MHDTHEVTGSNPVSPISPVPHFSHFFAGRRFYRQIKTFHFIPQSGFAALCRPKPALAVPDSVPPRLERLAVRKENLSPAGKKLWQIVPYAAGVLH